MPLLFRSCRWYGTGVAIDLQVIYPQDNIPLTQVQLLSGYSPAAVLAFGEDFASVDEVWVNESLSPRWTVLSRTSLVAQVPDLQIGRTVTSVEVLSNQITVGPSSRLRFMMGRGGGRCSGTLRLVQLFTKLLLQTPGTDIFAQQSGGGLLSKMGQQVSMKDGGKGVIGDLVLCCASTVRQIIATQSQDPSIPPSERLLSANVQRAVFDRQSLGVTASIRITSHSGVQGYANMLL